MQEIRVLALLNAPRSSQVFSVKRCGPSRNRKVFDQKVVRSFKLQSAIDVDLNGIDGMAIERTEYENFQWGYLNVHAVIERKPEARLQGSALGVTLSQRLGVPPGRLRTTSARPSLSKSPQIMSRTPISMGKLRVDPSRGHTAGTAYFYSILIIIRMRGYAVLPY